MVVAPFVDNMELIVASQFFEQFKELWPWLVLAALPVLARVVLIMVFFPQMVLPLNEEQRTTDAGKTLSLSLAGFSFAAFMALIIASATSSSDLALLEVPVVLVVVSFSAYFLTFMLASYTVYEWINQLQIAFEQVGHIGLGLSIVSMTCETIFTSGSKVAASIMVLTPPTIDWLADVKFWCGYFSRVRDANGTRTAT